MTQRKFPEPEDDQDRAILGHITGFGWSVIGIEEEADAPSYSFSVGLYHTLGHPELVILGQKPETAHRLINHAGEMIRAGRRFTDGERTDGILDGYPAVFVNIEERYFREYFGYARWFYRGSDFPMLQIVWPDKTSGAFPWEDGYTPELFWRQRVLGRTERWPHGWPFLDPPNVATFTSRQVGDDRKPILLVTHDENGAWQFHTGDAVTLEDARVVSLEQMLLFDPTLADLGNLGYGWRATRASADAPWERAKMES